MHTLPLKTRQQIATLHVLSELVRVGVQFAPPLEYVRWLEEIHTGNEDAIDTWLRDLEPGNLYETGFYPAFQELVYAERG